MTVSGPPRRYEAGPGIRARGLRTHAQAHAVEAADRAATGGDGVDAQDGRAQPDARDFDVERAFVFAGEVADVGGCAAHVEGDDLGEARGLRGARRADDAAGGSREDRVLAVEGLGVAQAARGLHELQACARE